jgi:hypothetical protein
LFCVLTKEFRNWISWYRKAIDTTHGRKVDHSVVPKKGSGFQVPETVAVYCTCPMISVAELVHSREGCKQRGNRGSIVTNAGWPGVSSG